MSIRMLTISNPFRSYMVETIEKARECSSKNYLTTQLVLDEINRLWEEAPIHTTTHSKTWCNKTALLSQSRVTKASSATTANLNSNCQRLVASVRMFQVAGIHVANVSCQRAPTSMLISHRLVKQHLESTRLRIKTGTRWAPTRSSISSMWLTEREQRT